MDTIKIPVELWKNIKRTIISLAASCDQELVAGVLSVDDSPPDPDEEYRRERIVELADTMPWVHEGQVEIDSTAELSDGVDNGCYVSAWVWCDFSNTEFSKECGLCHDPAEPGELQALDLDEKRLYVCLACFDDERSGT